MRVIAVRTHRLLRAVREYELDLPVDIAIGRLARKNLGVGGPARDRVASALRASPDDSLPFLNLHADNLRDLERDQTKQKIVSSLIQLCHGLGKEISAEGVVERGGEGAVLVEVGCDFLQRFLLRRPHPLLRADDREHAARAA